MEMTCEMKNQIFGCAENNFKKIRIIDEES